MDRSEVKINLFAPIAIGLTLWFGFSGKVDWLVIVLLLAWQIDIALTIKR